MEEGPDFLVLKDGGKLPPSYSNPSDIRNYIAKRLSAVRAAARRRMDELSSVPEVKESIEERRGGTWVVPAVLLGRRASGSGRLEALIEDERGALRVAVDKEAMGDLSSLLPDEPALFHLERRGGRLVLKRVERIGAAFQTSPLRSSRRIYAAFLSDLHCGDDSCGGLERFVRQVEEGELERDVSRNLSYVVIGGDLVDCGRGEPRNVYNEVGRILRKLPEEVVKVVLPGECDPSPNVLPQPPIEKRFRGILEEVPNVYFVGNPSLVSMSGVRALLYHGQTLPKVMEYLGVERPTLAMRRLLSMRTLVPVIGTRDHATFPQGVEELDIPTIPDIFFAGHTHMADALRSENVLFLSTPSWRHERGPRVPSVAVINLSSMDVLWRGPLPSEDRGNQLVLL